MIVQSKIKLKRDVYYSDCTTNHRQVTIHLPKFVRKAFHLAGRINNDIDEDAKAGREFTSNFYG